MAEAAAARALEAAVRREVSACAAGKFDRRALPRLLRWLGAVPLEFLRTALDLDLDHLDLDLNLDSELLSLAGAPRRGASKPIRVGAAAAGSDGGNAAGGNLAGSREWRARLEYAIYEHLGALRIGEFFDIIVEFPDSLPAVEDLRQCLRRTTLHAQLTSSLRRALQVPPPLTVFS